MALINDTPIAVPMGEKPISTFVIGDEVLVGELTPNTNNATLQWLPAKVGFSAGTGGSGTEMLVYIRFASQDKDIICSTGTKPCWQTDVSQRSQNYSLGNYCWASIIRL